MIPFVFILACSGIKADVASCPAGDLYKGQIFLKGKAIAEAHKVPYWILSAKHGIIMPCDVIQTYDEKLKKPYAGPFPPEPFYGFYVGGQSYFKNFPERFKPLVKPALIGKMLAALKDLEDNPEKTLELLKAHPNHALI